MKKYYLIGSVALLSGISASAQGAMDAANIMQSDIKGTARYMSMGGAFGALGGDLSAITQNPGGIGVYRSNEIGITVNLDAQHAGSRAPFSPEFGVDKTHFLLNNVGIVGTIRTGSDALPNINLGFVYNKGVSFNRTYAGRVDNLQNSLSNYVAGMSNSNRVSIGDVETTSNYNPYNPNDGYTPAPWLSVLGFDSFFMSPTTNDDMNPGWAGQFGQGTSGNGTFDVSERGSIEDYNIVIGGNINNIVYWGMNFDITNLQYRQESIWGEDLANAYVDGAITSANWDLYNYYKVAGTGFNYQLGVIVKPIQELRIGLTYHTPTWYTLTETYYADTNYRYDGDTQYTSAQTNDGMDAQNIFNFRTGGKLIASLAGVIANRVIVSADYEWEPKHAARMSRNTGGYGWGYNDDDWWWGDYWYPAPATRGRDNSPYASANNDIKKYLSSQNTLRLGAEVRLLPQLSVRAGYAHVSSPVTSAVRSNSVVVATAGTQPAYRCDNSTNYYTCGLGFHTGKFYADLAYVYKHTSATYHAFTPDPEPGAPRSPQAHVGFDNNQIVLSTGVKF